MGWKRGGRSVVRQGRANGGFAGRGVPRGFEERRARTMLKIGSNFYILASSLASHRSTRVLACGESFAVLDAGGDILESPLEALGFFHRDTRYLSRFELKIAGEVPYLLNSYLSDGPDYGTKQHCICG